jgi:hypothetical protein
MPELANFSNTSQGRKSHFLHFSTALTMTFKKYSKKLESLVLLTERFFRSTLNR